MGLDEDGFYTSKTKVSATSVFFESMPYKMRPVHPVVLS